MTDKTQPTAHAEITAPISADLRGIEQEAPELQEPSPTAGMNLGQRIMHVGGRENAAGYIEFGSVAAVRALVGQVLRDLQAAPPAPAEHAATLWVEDNGCIDFETSPFFAKPPGEYQLYTAPPAPAAVAVPADLAKRIKDCAAHWAYMERIDHGDQAEVEKQRHAELVDQFAAAPAQEHAAQLAGQVQDEAHAADMQSVGEAFMAAIEDNYAALQAAGWSRPADCPSEIVADLLDLIAEAKAAPAQAQEDAPALEAPAAPECERCGLSPTEHDLMHWCDNQTFRFEDGSVQLDMTPLATAPQAPAAPSTHAGILAAAAHIQAKASAYAEECGSYDPDTGAVEMSSSNQEHFNTLDELAEEIRLLADKAAPEACDKPPAGWTCSRAPGHGGPCAAAPAAPAVDALDHTELQEVLRAVEQFADCGETDVSYALLMRAAQTGYLECTHFQVVNEAALNRDVAIAAQAKGGE